MGRKHQKHSYFPWGACQHQEIWGNTSQSFLCLPYDSWLSSRAAALPSSVYVRNSECAASHSHWKQDECFWHCQSKLWQSFGCHLAHIGQIVRPHHHLLHQITNIVATALIAVSKDKHLTFIYNQSAYTLLRVFIYLLLMMLIISYVE